MTFNLRGMKKSDTEIIPSDWGFQKLEALISDKPKYGINAPAVDYSPDLPRYLRITDITESGRYSHVKRASVASTNADEFYLEEGDIVVARTGASVGKSYLYKADDGPLVYAGFLIRLRPNRAKLLPEFLFTFMQTNAYWGWVQVMSTRSGQPGVNGQEYAQLSIPLPPISEQQKIVDILSTWDRAIELTEKLIAAKQKRKQALMQQLLTGKVRFPEFLAEPVRKRAIGEVFDKVRNQVRINTSEEYREIGIRSHGLGVFHKENVLGSTLGNKRVFWVKPNCLTLNIVFAWERAIAVTGEEEKGMIASHRFPMFAPDETQVLPE